MGINGSGTAQDLLVHLEELALASLWRETDRLDAALHALEPQQAEIAGARMSVLDALQLYQEARSARVQGGLNLKWDQQRQSQGAHVPFREAKDPGRGHEEEEEAAE